MIRILLKNHLKRNRISNFKITAKNLFGFLALLILSLSLLSLFGFIIYSLTDTFYRLDLEDVYLTVVFFILLIVLTLYEIINIIKQLYQSSDNDIYLKLPVKKEELFVSKVIFIYLQQLLVSFVFLGVTAGVFGIVSHLGFSYYLKLVVIALVLPLLPLSLASLLSVPVSYLQRVFKKNRYLLLLGILLILGAFFFLYISFINIVLKFINLTGTSETSNILHLIPEIRASIKYLNISGLFYKMLIGNKFFINFTYIVLAIIVLAVGSFFLLKYFYFKALSSQQERTSFSAKKIVKVKGTYATIFSKEMKMLLRNPNLAFQAIVMNILMPVFVILTIMLTDEAGRLAVGEEIVPGITILTILIFILLANGFQGTIVSREKKAYYLSKIIPVKPFKQIFARLSFGLILSAVMLTITTILIIAFDFINAGEAIFVYFMSLAFLIGYTFNAVSRDYKNPQLTSNEGGLDEGVNMFNTLLEGLLVAVFLGLVKIIVPYFVKLFPITRTFKILGFIYISITEKRAYNMLYAVIFLTIGLYALISALRLRKAVKRV
ncbi:MAG: hypothetical protein M0P92_06275 [Acholeplasmataceae bacterium]|nr:hypothetical protein [Acholeplasmataceae bacterium]